MRPQTQKADTGPYKRQQLLKFLEEQGKNEKDWEQNKPYVKEEHCKGKRWVPPQVESSEDSEAYKSVSSDWDEILEGASEADIVELASILGFASMVNQSQYNAAQQKVEGFEFGNWSSAAKAEKLKFVAPEPDNSTDVDESIRQLKANDPSLTSLNLNNIKVIIQGKSCFIQALENQNFIVNFLFQNISIEKLNKIFEAMETNTNLKTLNMSNVDMTDSVGKVSLANSIESSYSYLFFELIIGRCIHA